MTMKSKADKQAMAMVTENSAHANFYLMLTAATIGTICAVAPKSMSELAVYGTAAVITLGANHVFTKRADKEMSKIKWLWRKCSDNLSLKNLSSAVAGFMFGGAMGFGQQGHAAASLSLLAGAVGFMALNAYADRKLEQTMNEAVLLNAPINAPKNTISKPKRMGRTFTP